VHPSTDDQLVLRFKAGDREAFGELYARYRPRVYRFALKLLQNSDQAEDCTQEAFLKAGRTVGGLLEASSLRAWLFSIVRNEVLEHFRKTRRNGQLTADDVWNGKSPHEDVVTGETTEIVQHMIGLLKSEYREVLVLREYEQMSYTEIAAVTGDSESSVKSRLFKARKALVKTLKPYFGKKS